MCLPDTCEPGQTECGPSTLYICNDEGVWEAHPCPDGQSCVFGACVECVDEASCPEGEVCEDGVCVGTAPSIITRELPPATEGLMYSFSLDAEGGIPPYSWTLVEGMLPGGMELALEGVLRGTPSTTGTSDFTVMVTDAGEATDQRAFELEVFPAGPVVITTTALPNAEHGYDYSFPLAATGGTPPYAWQLLAGPLPPGMILLSDGIISGVPDDVGAFPLTFRVIDAADPPGYDSRELGLFVEIAPLVITGDPIYNLLLTKVVVLPVLVPYIPYRTTLEARGGLKPYTWSEQDPPEGIGWLVSTWGFPEGLSLDASGAVSGWVTDVSDAQPIMIPFGPELTGYFIYIRVEDSQDPADSDAAIYCLPTVPLG